MSKIIETSLIGETIKQLRLSRHWTQEDLADRTFYSVRNIRRIENEGTRSIDVVNTFAELFGVSALDILNGVSFFSNNLSDNKKSIGDLHLTLLTLICYSRTSTIG